MNKDHFYNALAFLTVVLFIGAVGCFSYFTYKQVKAQGCYDLVDRLNEHGFNTVNCKFYGLSPSAWCDPDWKEK